MQIVHLTPIGSAEVGVSMMGEWACRHARPALVDVHDDLATGAFDELHRDRSLLVCKSTGQDRITADFLAGMGQRGDLQAGVINLSFEQVKRRGRLAWL